MMKNSIRNWLIVPFIGLFLLPLLFLGGLLSLQNNYKEKERVKQEQQNFTVLASEKISSFLWDQGQTLSSLLKTNYLPGMTSEQINNLLTLFQAAVKDDRNLPVFNKISLFNEEGRETIRVSRNHLVLETDQQNMSVNDEFMIPAATNSLNYSPVYFDEKTGEPYIAFSLPIRDLRTLALRGIIVAEIHLKSIWQTVATMHIGKHGIGIAFITSEDGRVISHKNRSIVLKNTNFNVPSKPTVMTGTSGKKSLITANSIQLGEQTLFFVSEVPAAEAFKHINTILMLTGVFFLLFLLGGVLFGFIVLRQIVSPIEKLADSARNISQGNYVPTEEIERKDELGDLAEAFNTMIAKLFSTITQLEQEQEFVRNVIKSLTHPFYVIDVKDYSIKLANSAAIKGPLTGNLTCYELTHNSQTPCEGDEHPCPIQLIVATKEPVVLEHVHQMGDGKKHTMEIHGYPIFDKHGEVIQIIEYNLDVTEKKNLERQLQQSQKLEAVGILTGGVAHDFNNLLTTIIGYSQLGIMRNKENDSERNYYEIINDSGERAAKLVSQLLAFSRKQLMEIRVVNLNTIVNDLSKMLDRVIGEDITIQMVLNESIGNIKADPGQIEQVIMNLVVNARDAMPNGGTLYLETDSVELDEEYCKSHLEASPGSYVFLSVTDTGTGMTPEVKEKIFDPFFTTKKLGHGTGLGLSTVHGIIKQMNGHIYLYSELGRGTTFKIYFPEVLEEGVEDKKNKAVMLPGTETVLVVDDEPSILRLIKETLQPLGYKTMTASSAEEALEIIEDTTTDIDLLLTDVIMQNMNGMELVNSIKPRQPNMKVLFMSGYTDNIIARKGNIKEDVNYIPKPITPTLLTTKIRAILDKD